MKRIAYLEAKLKVRLITSEFEILAWLYLHGPTRSRDLSAKTRSSPANYQIIVKRLRAAGIISSQEDYSDGRARIYDLAPAVRQDFADAFEQDPDGRAVLSEIALGQR